MGTVLSDSNFWYGTLTGVMMGYFGAFIVMLLIIREAKEAKE